MYTKDSPKTYMGFDFGSKYLGIALGQTITGTAQPLTTLKMLDEKPNWQLLDRLVQEWQPDGFIVGLALQPDGKHSKTSIQAKHFGESLQQRYQKPVYFIEERLTSVAARETIRDKARPSRHNKAEIDRISAAIILESWLNSIAYERSS
ncbi:Holliday junction resolvase RuvX [Candidatus Berkiella cookevillensis]|uniref:Putative pre-16S rRNA nuclease n=1 Tax=Candidatus Berkiella cookevillensis TaxID=437022 RepID=A0A0Q9YN64_9GAMM|nr:Holliday junction resolvase RuvX [Candidatus Berkiella cookevillensis]MCS5707418.1 Holliday junction resolvase RuvX [Candidatus Berkiella cookevillensis]